MAQVTYRGVKYDSEEYRNMVLAEAQQRNHDLMYRGLKVVKKSSRRKVNARSHRNPRCQRSFLDDHLR